MYMSKDTVLTVSEIQIKKRIFVITSTFTYDSIIFGSLYLMNHFKILFTIYNEFISIRDCNKNDINERTLTN